MPNAPRTVVFKEPQWRTGQRIRLLIWGLRVRVPPGVAFFTSSLFVLLFSFLLLLFLLLFCSSTHLVPLLRRYGATVAREIPDLKVGGSNPSSVTASFLYFLLRCFKIFTDLNSNRSRKEK
jgi:hypothetical protein